MSTLRNALVTAAAALSLTACGPQGPESQEPAQNPSNAVADAAQDAVNRGSTGQLDPLFDKAARQFNVPADLLKAISFTETRWQMVRGEEEFPGQAPAFGLMALRGAALERGAALAGVSAEEVRNDEQANILAGAALLSAYADELKVDRADLGAWAPAVVRLSGIDHTDAQAEHVHRGVYATLRNGVVAEGADGKVTASIMPTQVEAKFAAPSLHAKAAGPDYAPAIWRPSPNYNARPASPGIKMIVIHTCEGSYSSCWSWLVNSASGVSAHYVVNESGSEISQLVTEANRGWHVGATYDCSLNSSQECGLNGLSVNHFAVGIEHGGFASQTSFPTGQIDASAALSCDISRDQGIPRDSYHIVAHGKLQPSSRTDPGPNWPWATYLNKINAACGSTAITIDSNQANNDTSKGYIQVSANWVSSSNVAGYYGSGYYAAPAQAISDPAIFWFYLPAAGTKTIDAWWTAATDRATAAPFIITNAAGTNLATVNVNQQINGGRWNTLGSWSFPAGWNKVQLSRWTSSGSQVIADAVRVR
jgi:N-acetyl-anhydromuramyl-L-alanine amidase AmpD/predicted small lipoprotein YifL